MGNISIERKGLYVKNRNVDKRWRLPGTERGDAWCGKGYLFKDQGRGDLWLQRGYKGLIYANFEMLTPKDFSGILTMGGTILGTSRQPFKLMRVPDEKGLDKVEAMKHTYHKLNLNCLVILGGNGTHKTANLLREEGLNIIYTSKDDR